MYKRKRSIAECFTCNSSNSFEPETGKNISPLYEFDVKILLKYLCLSRSSVVVLVMMKLSAVKLVGYKTALHVNSCLSHTLGGQDFVK